MSRWFYLNMALLCLAVWNVAASSSFPALRLTVLFGFLGLLFVLFNWTRHAVFSTIRNSRERRRKIRFANLSKRVLPYHRWTGTMALLLILTHAGFVLVRYGFYWQNGKMATGVLAAIVLAAVVVTGWMRLYRPSGRKRKIHLFLGMSLFFLIAAHLLF
ncbi:hypothetical protein ACFOGI_10170 [Virgibacillus xinjiangensis]|uniref:Ferric oxidoreductase domain-containing protein n=1 Tax=Virgibacillus xinjiangensis TaxID=393090 RepID=A0ABV7CVW1_9BACI